MTENNAPDDDRPVLFCLHYLGGSAREWNELAARLAPVVRVVALDLPGFGDAAAVTGYTVREMTAYVSRAVRDMHAPGWFLAGHSMGAKVAAAIARDVEDAGAPSGLLGVVTVAGSPPSPEPMDESARNDMLGKFRGGAASRREDARTYVDANSVELRADRAELAIDDVLRANRLAWTAWLASGSREDWSARVGVLQAPALVVAGERDQNLGPRVQRELMLPHFARARTSTIPDAGHLLPLEAPAELARVLAEFVRDVAYDALIASERVSSQTRRALVERGKADDPSEPPAALDAAAFAALRAVAARVVPQRGDAPIDLARRIDERIASGDGDGWRFAVLPPDAAAYAAALQTLDAGARERYGAEFAALAERDQDELLEVIAAGSFDIVSAKAAGSLDAMQMRAWFEDLRADAVQAYVLHPRTLARFGYSGIANGGDGPLMSGFARIGIGEREAWEPRAACEVRS